MIDRTGLPDAVVRLIARQYDEAKHDPHSHAVGRAYEKLRTALLGGVVEMGRQGIEILVIDNDPYEFAADYNLAAGHDMVVNRHIKVWKYNGDMPEDHPLAEVINGVLSLNTLFRACHEFYGHFLGGVGLNHHDEVLAHRFMLAAKGFAGAEDALFTENIGQLCWHQVNGTFGPQKACILPMARWVL